MNFTSEQERLLEKIYKNQETASEKQINELHIEYVALKKKINNCNDILGLKVIREDAEKFIKKIKLITNKNTAADLVAIELEDYAKNQRKCISLKSNDSFINDNMDKIANDIILEIKK